jgi:hypothetical protein
VAAAARLAGETVLDPRPVGRLDPVKAAELDRRCGTRRTSATGAVVQAQVDGEGLRSAAVSSSL